MAWEEKVMVSKAKIILRIIRNKELENKKMLVKHRCLQENWIDD